MLTCMLLIYELFVFFVHCVLIYYFTLMCILLVYELFVHIIMYYCVLVYYLH